MPLSHYAIAALVAGLLAIERKAFLQASMSRPLVAGALIGLALGEPYYGLMIGAGLELFFLGAVNMGAALPDNELFTAVAATACGCALAHATQLPGPPVFAIATLVALPASKLGKYTDRLSESVNQRVAGQFDGRDPKLAVRHNLYGLWMPLLSTSAMALAGSAVGAVLLPRLLAHAPPGLPRALSVVWTGFLLVAAAAGIRAIRTERAGRYAGIAALVVAGVQAARAFVL